MLRDNLVELIEPMLNSAGAAPLALYIHNRTQASDDRLPCLKNPRPEGAESSLTESASSPFQAEPAHLPVLSADPIVIQLRANGRLLISQVAAVDPISLAQDSVVYTFEGRVESFNAKDEVP